MDDIDLGSEDNEESIEEPPINVKDYLDPSILDVKVINEDELEQYEIKSEISDSLSKQYEETFWNRRGTWPSRRVTHYTRHGPQAWLGCRSRARRAGRRKNRHRQGHSGVGISARIGP